MNRRWPALFIAFVTLPGLAASQVSDGLIHSAPFSTPGFTVGLDNFIINRDAAFAVGEPILVAGPKVTQAVWSPDGQYILFEQSRKETRVPAVQGSIVDDKAPASEDYLCVYSLADGRASDVMRFGEGQHSADIYWLTGSTRALVAVRQELAPEEDAQGRLVAGQDLKLYMADAADGSITEFSPWNGMDKPSQILVQASPAQPYAFVDATFPPAEVHFAGQTDKPQPPSRQVLLVTADKLHTALPLPEGAASEDGLWSQDGLTAYLMTRTAGSPPRAIWYKVSLSDGSLTKSDRPTSFYTGEPAAGLLTVRNVGEQSTNEKVTKKLNTLWLETPDPDSQNRVLLCGDGQSGDVNKTLDAASYIAQGSLYLRPIAQVPKRRFDDEVAAWKRQQTMENARQAGIALLMYAADYDNTLPSIRDKWMEMISPYLGNGGALNGFVYTFPGGPQGDIRDPAGTQLGYIDGGDGRAVVYADGHVQWSPKS